MHPIAVAPYLGGMVSRRASLGLVALLVVGLTGCTGAPARDPSDSPSPAATRFASEEEAFAAAEETYRAYIDATNAENAGDESANPLQYQHGELQKASEALADDLSVAGLHYEGDVVITSIERQAATVTAGAGQAELLVCHDATEQRLINADGDDVTPAGTERYGLRVEFMSIEGKMLMISSANDAASQC
ncbi:hypothetical protein E4U02_15100 [Microbacterium paludicola]|uniref:Uncharacterized protein n=1 Tax=Microbacterium paludicola TaxID=300019 RepID=A0A4Y9FM21_9MICO|nr:hypothetical protein [Microbacterium paludicola]MBF0817732.1 hypothetical protein [Microbacterium paludicola]TFU30066.1 hypothetical protein E4U02_15100 [Microbacterium paludicola]